MYVFLSVSNWSSCIYFLFYFLETILYGIISFYFFYKKHNIQCLWPVINCSRHKSVTRWPSFRAVRSPTPREASALHHVPNLRAVTTVMEGVGDQWAFYTAISWKQSFSQKFEVSNHFRCKHDHRAHKCNCVEIQMHSYCFSSLGDMAYTDNEFDKKMDFKAKLISSLSKMNVFSNILT